MSAHPIYPGNVRVWCPAPECGWWREAPAISTDWMLKERNAHWAATNHAPVPPTHTTTTTEDQP